MSIQFESPGTSDQLDLAKVLNSLLIVRPNASVTAQTAYGEKEAVEADVWVVDGEQAGSVYRNAWIFPLVLAAQLRRATGTGKFVIGRLTKKPPVRPGTNPAWALSDPTAEDRAAAQAFATQHNLDKDAPSTANPAAPAAPAAVEIPF